MRTRSHGIQIKLEASRWRVFRSQLLDESVSYNYVSNIKSDQKDNKDVWGEGQDSWGDGQDNWGDDQEDWGETPQGNLNCKFDFHEGAQEYLENEAKQWGQEDKESVKTVLQNTIVPTVMTEESDDVNKDKCLTSRQPLEGIEALAQLSVKDPSDCGNTQLDSSPSSEVISSEELLVDEEGIHRMMELMAVPERDKPKEMQTICANNVVCLPAYYINVFEETTDDSELTSHVASLLHNYEEKEGKKVQALVEENRMAQRQGTTIIETYEKADVPHGDYQCHKFIMRLKLCPEQCIRYQWNGSPLLISQPKDGKLAVENCSSCGGTLVFELQLVPPILQFLRFPGQSEPAVEFGTVLIFTCKSSCWSQADMWKEEQVVLQPDPDQYLLR
ncbi:programmed cell death protein 2-like isoform X2 [Pomacea canaliculata]|uniref:programmed cell death protein 2-like isoform X2 n=1 Tax=Pomacea canaliculata TaxID=400727 RepID=UPI000D7390BA|nr:programmed cell death protein 2-like isoform X2 [Pomacea canaliculata]